MTGEAQTSDVSPVSLSFGLSFWRGWGLSKSTKFQVLRLLWFLWEYYGQQSGCSLVHYNESMQLCGISYSMWCVGSVLHLIYMYYQLFNSIYWAYWCQPVHLLVHHFWRCLEDGRCWLTLYLVALSGQYWPTPCWKSNFHEICCWYSWTFIYLVSSTINVAINVQLCSHHFCQRLIYNCKLLNFLWTSLYKHRNTN